jgi:hypothetical protein
MAKKSKSLTKDIIVEHYMQYVLTNGKRPHNVFEFSKNLGYDEASFYQIYSDFDQIEAHFFGDMFEYSLSLLSKTEEYENYDASQKLSSLYFTFFEMATANRSFVKYLLEGQNLSLKSMEKFKDLRQKFIPFINSILKNPIKIDVQALNKVQNKVLVEGAWAQFMSVFAYWMKDQSPGFEKTDIYIEKNVKASFDVVYSVPFDSLFDFGKFLWKEKMSN